MSRSRKGEARYKKEGNWTATARRRRTFDDVTRYTDPPPLVGHRRRDASVVEARHASWRRSANLVSTALAILQKILSSPPLPFLFFPPSPSRMDTDGFFLFLFLLSSFDSTRKDSKCIVNIGCRMYDDAFFCGIGKMMKLLSWGILETLLINLLESFFFFSFFYWLRKNMNLCNFSFNWKKCLSSSDLISICTCVLLNLLFEWYQLIKFFYFKFKYIK